MPAIRQETAKLTGELAAWRVAGGEGWGIGAIVRSGERIEVTGKLLGVRAGDTVELEGVWVEHPRYGRQLKVKRCTTARPETADGIVAWLSSTLPDVGEGRARTLVERFGGKLWEVIECRPDDLTQVTGITPKRAMAIREAYMAHKADRDDMILLRGWGLTDGQVARCVAQWRTLAEVVAHVRGNPYELCQHVYGFGFLRADKVATKAGIAHDAPERVRAGVEHVLEEATTDGHCYVSGGALQKMAAELLSVELGLVAKGIRAAVQGGGAVRRGWRIYPRRMDDAEQACANALRKLLGRAA